MKELINEINAAWISIVGSGCNKKLRSVVIQGSIVAAGEEGFFAPKAGGDAAWLKENHAAFKKKADEGDLDFQDLMEDLQTREIFRGILKE